MKLNKLKNKRILILGFGREGRDSFKFLRRLFPRKIFGIADAKKELGIKNNELRKDKKIKWHLGENYLKALENYDVIIKSPGIPIHLPEIEKAYKKKKITSQTEIFFENCPGKIIGVTGTKGKGTITLLIYRILKEGLKVHPIKFASQTFNKVNLVGNIEKPALNFLFSATKNDIYVYEMSSHQLFGLKRSPQIAVFLNIYPDHLDYFKSFKEYISAKTNIVRYQKKDDYLIYNSEDKIVKKIAKKSKAKKIPYLLGFSSFLALCPKGFRCASGKWKSSPRLFKNIMAAVIVGKIFGILIQTIIKVIKNFKLLPHRLEYVGDFKGIKFYNDSASTMPESTIFALDCLGNKIQTIILGGSEKNISFNPLIKRILKSKIKNLIFFLPTGQKIWQGLKKNLSFQAFFVNNMKEAVELAYQHTQKGKICLLSPASASFGLFQDYKERGRLFKKYVKKIAQKRNLK